MIQAGALQRQQLLLSGAARDEQGTDGEIGSAGEPLASIDHSIAASFADYVRHWTGSDSATFYFQILAPVYAERSIDVFAGLFQLFNRNVEMRRVDDALALELYPHAIGPGSR